MTGAEISINGTKEFGGRRRRRTSGNGWNRGDVPSGQKAHAPTDPFMIVAGSLRAVVAVNVIAAIAILAVVAPAGGHSGPTSSFVVTVSEGGGTLAGTPMDFPAFGFRVTPPDGWEVRTGVDDVGMFYPGTNANMFLAPNPGCVAGSLDEAVSVLESYLSVFGAYSGYQVYEPPAGRWIDNHAAAGALISHFLADGRAYQVLAVILGPELSTIWTFSGLMHNASEVSLRPTMNATLESFVALDGSSPTSYSDPSQRFGLEVPPGWSAEANVSVGIERLDVLLSSVRSEVTFAVASDAFSGGATYEAARGILEGALTGLSSQPGFQILEPVAPVQVDSHVGAQAVVTWQPSTFNVVQVITVVLSPEFRLSWGLIGTMFSWDALFARSCVNATLKSFDILGSEPVASAPDWLTANQMWILLAALVATATEGAVMGVLIIRGSRKH